MRSTRRAVPAEDSWCLFPCALLERLKTDPDQTARQAAASSLGQSGDKSVVPALLGILRDPDTAVGAAAHALGRLAAPEAIPALEAFAKAAQDKRHIDAATRAIESIEQRAR